jgi:hypothetical protein
MREDGDNAVRITIYFEIEPVVPVHSPLPDIIGSTVFFGVNRGMAKILGEQAKLLINLRLKLTREPIVVLVRSAG